MSGEELIQKLNEKDLTPKNVYYGDYNIEDTEEFGNFEEVEQYGGEGQGDDWYVVYHFTKYDIYLRADAWYASYHGIDGWKNWREVRPVVKEVTFYE